MALQNRSVNHNIQKASLFQVHECGQQMLEQSTYYIMQYLPWKWNFDAGVVQDMGKMEKDPPGKIKPSVTFVLLVCLRKVRGVGKNMSRPICPMGMNIQSKIHRNLSVSFPNNESD